MVSCSARLPLNPFNWYGADFLLLFWSLCLTLMPLALWLRHRGRGPAEAVFGLPLSTYELVRLAGGGQLLADSAFAAMAFAGHVELLPDQKIRRKGTAPPTDPYERTVWQLFNPEAWADLPTMRQRAMQAHLGAVRALDDDLVRNGLLLPPAVRQRLNRLPLFTLLGLGIFGLVKVLVGLSRGRPVGFLLLSLALLAVVGGLCQRRGAWATGRRARLLETTVAAGAHLPSGSLSTQTVALNVALFGVAHLQTLGLGELATLLVPPIVSGSEGGGDSSSGCGGSGCGSGGCGGCGGCGS